MLLNHRRSVSVGVVLAALAMPGPVQATSTGVHVDPNSPPGKEYAIPVVAARGQGGATPSGASSNPGRSSAAGTSQTTPPAANGNLFGSGISPAARPKGHAAKPRAAGTLRPSTTRPAYADVSRRFSDAGGGGSSAVFWVLAGLALLIPGLGVGVCVRRWRRA